MDNLHRIGGRSNPRDSRAMVRARGAVLRTLTASYTKTVIVDLIATIPSLRFQRLAATIVCGVWPGFSRA